MPVTCGLCPKTFSRIGNVNRHMKQVHGVDNTTKKNQTNTFLHLCDICGKRFRLSPSLLQHKIRMHGVSKINSDIRKFQNLRVAITLSLIHDVLFTTVQYIGLNSPLIV